MPARNEVLTVADNVAAARGCRHVREVIVVDDGSDDGTGDMAAAAGARVVRRQALEGSKAHAMEEGVAASDAEAILFVDADCIGLTSQHLDEICEPCVRGKAAMSLGTFDYGIFNWIVLFMPHTTGERVIPRWVFEAIPPSKLDGFTIETKINEVIAEGRLPAVARVMRGVTHRTKREKFGPVEGWKRTLEMFTDIFGLIGETRLRAYWFYLRGLTIER